jgi:hypothetical protein
MPVDPACTKWDDLQTWMRQQPTYKNRAPFDDLGDCLNHTAQSWALGPDSADVVAKAVVSHCKMQFDLYEAQQTGAFRTKMPAVEARAEFDEDLVGIEDEAREYVVEARAAHCPARPNSN